MINHIGQLHLLPERIKKDPIFQRKQEINFLFPTHLIPDEKNHLLFASNERKFWCNSKKN